ncbi:MAG: hypothetical protein JWN44_6329 [Myxococcales bacterium]|nr:hypothetical protein [Myxococcales bacterium]
MLLSVGTARARGTCVVEGKKTTPIVIEVAPRDATPFKLRVEGVPVAVELGGLETPATVHVRGALVFDGKVRAGEIPARTKRTVESLNGMLRLPASTEKLTLYANVRSKWVDADVHLPGVELRGVSLPCDGLTMDDVASPKPSLEDDGSARLVAVGKVVHFRNQPGPKGQAMEVLLDDPDALELRRLEEQGGYLRVTNRWADGTMLTGWVKREELTAAGAHHERIGDVTPVTAACTDKPRAAAANERVVTATVAAGTQLFAARYLGAWGKVAEGTKLQVRFRPKDDWVEIVGAPGIVSVTSCATNVTLDDAWIPRAAVKLPADATAVAPPAP